MPSTTRQRNPVRTYALRAAICLTLQAAQDKSLKIDEIVAALRAQGIVVAGRPSKTISDAMRTDLRLGRIVRVARGEYAYRRLPRSTAHDMRKRVATYLANPDARRPPYVTAPDRDDPLP